MVEKLTAAEERGDDEEELLSLCCLSVENRRNMDGGSGRALIAVWKPSRS